MNNFFALLTLCLDRYSDHAIYVSLFFAWLTGFFTLQFKGFEYCVEFTMGGYGPVEKTYHLCRRRRWVRTRKHVAQMAKKDIKKVCFFPTDILS